MEIERGEWRGREIVRYIYVYFYMQLRAETDKAMS